MSFGRAILFRARLSLHVLERYLQDIFYLRRLEHRLLFAASHLDAVGAQQMPHLAA